MPEAKTIGVSVPKRRFKPYPAYKDSGVEWLGEIPVDWHVRPVYARYDVALGKMLDAKRVTGESSGCYLRNIDVQWDAVNTEGLPEMDFAPWERDRYLVRAGDLLVCEGGEVGRTAIWRGEIAECFYQKAIHRVRPRSEKEAPRFFYYLMYTLAKRGAFAAGGNPNTIDHLTAVQLRHYRLPFPPPKEQRVIAAFLDREAAGIDALVVKKERLIELLQEQRTALITRAVTKGLDPNVPMKESGVEWLGEIPAHWEVAALKRRAKRIQTGSTPPTGETQYYEDGVVPWYGPGSFAEDLPLQEPVKFISEGAVRDGVARVFEARSAVIVTIGATIGKVAFMEHPGSCNQQITGVTFNIRQVFPRYGAYQLKRLEPVLRGIAPNTTLPIIDQEQVGYLPFAVPPATEQEPIAAFLDRETARIDTLVAKVHDAIDRLKELRIVLISAAVTGKIDVREAATA